MKTIRYGFFLFAFAYYLQGCDEPVAPQDSRAIDDTNTSTLGAKDPFVLYAIASEDTYPPYKFLIEIHETPGHAMTIDWGDGSTQYIPYGGDPGIEKIYDAPGRYKVTVTGDIREITYIKSSYGEGVFDSINLSGLRKLGGIRMGLTSGPRTFDFAANTYLTEMSLTDIEELSNIILPKKHQLSYVSIAGPNSLPTSVVDYVIQNIYHNAVKTKIFDGYFDARKLWYSNEGDDEYFDLVGPPSPGSVAMLKELQDVYGWEIAPRLE